MKIFEVSWEVCNKVGGIYKVISSKAKYLKEKYGEDYILIGPYTRNSEFIKKETPSFLKDIEIYLKSYGIELHYGIWDINGRPRVILIDFKEFFDKYRNYWKYVFWERYRIDSLNSDFTYDEPFSWGIAVGMLIEKIFEKFQNEKIILHGHEWLSGSSILYIHLKNLPVKKILTLHGTSIGRELSERTLYNKSYLNLIDPDRDSYRLGIHYKYQLEKNAIMFSDYVTVVSDVLYEEVEKIFKKKPDKITYNYIDVKEKNFYYYYSKSLKWLEEFLTWYFYPYYDISEDIIFLYTIGRYEFHNKGIDLFIDLLDYLNKNKLNIIAFIFVPYENYGINEEVLKLYENYMNIREYLDENKNKIIQKIYKNEEILDIRYYRIDSKTPPIVTHNIKRNSIIEALERYGLNNSKENSVKVVYVPVYLGRDYIFNLGIEYIIPSMDIGIFLSRYEPFGYTPLESLYNYTPIILSNYMGINYLLNSKKIDSNCILRVDVNNFDLEKEKILSFIKFYKSMSSNDRINLKLECYKIAKQFDWKENIYEYIDIYEKI